ncbi:PREDICTED: uncharacterized protein LOC108557997, partial [Nicrophorus vespilloides]|uniref:Uncharacterized protein LOC108557997 n=1 Tax=Nicrophorus vespilloides TaxID=110193 RepID=A0ABM1M6S0_NICVS
FALFVFIFVIEDGNVHPSTQLSESSSGFAKDRYAGGVQAVFESNPLLAALYLSSSLGIPPVSTGFNHAQHLPINPYVALLLSHYGRYLNLPPNRTSKGIYGYTASNNYHNNKPFGAYKIQEDV